MAHLTTPLTARTTSFPGPPTRPRRRLLATLAAVVDSAFSPGGAAAHGGAPALAPHETQEHLIALGRLPESALSGRYDRTTMDALARFQAAEGLPVDGFPDAATADALLRATR
jgi:peptidoglycan hydrolase-like protein with peptidoglycan-binding domain